MILFLSLSQDRTFLLKIDSTLFDEGHFSNVTKPNLFLLLVLSCFFVCLGFWCFGFFSSNQKVNICIYIRKISCCEGGFLIHRFKDVQARKDHYDNSVCPLEYTCYRISLRDWLKADLLEDI